MEKIPKIEISRITIAENKTTELCYIKSENKRSTAILILPALGIAARSYSKLMQSLANEGYNVAVVDLRGQGNSSIIARKGINYGYQDLLVEDIPAAIQEVYILFQQPITLLGHSLGGQLASLYATCQDPRIDSLVLCASGSVYFKTWKGLNQIRVLAGTQFARFYAYIAGYFPGHRFSFGGRTFQRLIEDWGQQALTGEYKIANAHKDYEKGLALVWIPILILHLKDDFFAPTQSVLHLQDKLKSVSITQHCLDDSTLNHFNWLKKPDSFIQKIVDWDDSMTASSDK